MVTLLVSAAESVAVTATGEPSATGFGEADRVTDGVVGTTITYGLQSNPWASKTASLAGIVAKMASRSEAVRLCGLNLTAKYGRMLSATSSRSGWSRAYSEMNPPSASCAARHSGVSLTSPSTDACAPLVEQHLLEEPTADVLLTPARVDREALVEPVPAEHAPWAAGEQRVGMRGAPGVHVHAVDPREQHGGEASERRRIDVDLLPCCSLALELRVDLELDAAAADLRLEQVRLDGDPVEDAVVPDHTLPAAGVLDTPERRRVRLGDDVRRDEHRPLKRLARRGRCHHQQRERCPNQLRSRDPLSATLGHIDSPAGHRFVLPRN